MTEEWLIDGYNLLHSFPAATPRRPKLSREDLCKALADFASSVNHPVILVFDGKGNPAEFSHYSTKHLSILYSQSVTADAYIERYLFEHKGRCSFTVVTKDRAITNHARGCGARVLSPSIFMETLSAACRESGDVLFKEKVRSHGFNRPFEKKLKDKGFLA